MIFDILIVMLNGMKLSLESGASELPRSRREYGIFMGLELNYYSRRARLKSWSHISFLSNLNWTKKSVFHKIHNFLAHWYLLLSRVFRWTLRLAANTLIPGRGTSGSVGSMPALDTRCSFANGEIGNTRAILPEFFRYALSPGYFSSNPIIIPRG